jgi:YVTN family beta-propeller protein
MRFLGKGWAAHRAAWSITLFSGLVAAAGPAGCGDDDDDDANPGDAQSASSSSGGDPGGDPSAACTTTAPAATRGGAIAISPTDDRIVVANRDTGTVTVLAVEYDEIGPVMTKVAEIAVGAEPWQVAIDGCGATAYVSLRADKKLVEIVDLGGEPAKGREVAVGSEPTAVALSPNNASAYVANWVDGTVSVVDTSSMTQTSTVDLNATLAATGLLGDSVSAAKSRPALAHPRSLAITNDGDADDADEKLYVTEFFAQRKAPESPDGKSSDTNKVGVVYRVALADASAVAIELPPIADTGFVDHNGGVTGCFPNQLQAITVNGAYAYVASICASPVGPLGVFQKGACTSDAQCQGVVGACVAGSCKGSCASDADCGAFGSCDLEKGGACRPNVTDVRTTTHPAVHVIDVADDVEVAASRTNLNARWHGLYDQGGVADDSTRRYPLVADDIAFVPSSGVAYFSANGTDAVFRVKYDAASAAIEEVGAGPGKNFIDLGPASLAAEQKGQNPIGIVIANSSDHPFAFVANDVSRNVTALALPTQSVAGSDAADPRVIASSAPASDAADQARLRGKRFFNTGLGRWSLKGQGWGACQSCHVDGLTDNVTWYFGRGPRQSTSLDGSYASKDSADRRIFNWTAIFDEVDDFELNTRGVSGGIGALVSTNSTPPAATDRINLNAATATAAAGNAGLNGSTEQVTANESVLKDWDDVTDYIKALRSPSAPSNLDAELVAAGEKLFLDLETGGACQGCHGGDKWTISRVFYEPSGATNEALLGKPWDGAALLAAGFPAALLPATTGNQFMRAPDPKSAAADQIQCILRPVGTFGISPEGVSAVELRQDMTSPGQGADAAKGNGFNPPSLLGIQVGAPYLHAGNARTLEELFGDQFGVHAKALTKNVNFLAQEGDVERLVAYLLSIDESKQPVELPASAGAQGGDFCTAP